MGMDFGFIKSAVANGDEIVITAHQYVALALDRDDPIMVTRLIGVNTDNFKADVINLIATAADIYDVEITEINDKQHIKMHIGDDKPVLILANAMKVECRYYNAQELNEIFTWLPSQCNAQELQTHIKNVEKHGATCVYQNGT